MTKRSASTLVLLTLFVGGAARIHAQPSSAGEAAHEWIRPEEVPARADGLLRRLDATRPDPVAGTLLDRIERALPQLERDLETGLARVRDAIARSISPTELEDIRGELTDTASPLGDWKEKLEAEGQRVAAILDEVARAERIWSETRNRPETLAAGDVVIRRIESSIEALHGATERLRTWQSRILAVTDRVITRGASVDAAIDRLRAATAAERASLLVPNSPPLWSRRLDSEIRRELPRASDEIRAFAESTGAYIARDPRPLIVQAVLAVFLMLALGRFSTGALQRLAGEETAARAARLLERPYSIGLLLCLIASPVFHPLAPRRLMQLIVILALFPAARIVTHTSTGVGLTAFAGLLALLLLDRVGLALQALPALERATFLVALGIGFAMALRILRRLPGDAPWPRRAARLAVLGLALAILAEVGGWTYLATLLGRGIIASAIAGLYIYAAALALAALLAYGLASHTVRRSKLLGRNTANLQRRAEYVLRWLGAGVWVYLVTTALGLRSASADALARVLDAGVSVGALSLSIGGVLAFVLTLLTAFMLARFVTRALEEEVYPRTQLPRGVPYAVSTLVRYAVYSLGFLFALAAAGVQLGQVTIMLGGLGIGIGLGLQDLVKNFAAGLTLLFERRVQVGDALEMPSQGILGRVLSIGMRASVVRNWNGAEVVLPNTDLVSSAVTNWTLSDRLYRIEVPVGVAYGTDLDRVVAVLLDATRSNDRFLANPPPQALFKGFGDSSLDFVVRAWTDQGYDQSLSLTSELGLAVHRSLRDAGITIPFPQRDLHLASVSPAARASLSGPDRTG
jgi:small-conductance mechanosensitive channel